MGLSRKAYAFFLILAARLIIGDDAADGELHRPAYRATESYISQPKYTTATDKCTITKASVPQTDAPVPQTRCSE